MDPYRVGGGIFGSAQPSIMTGKINIGAIAPQVDTVGLNTENMNFITLQGARYCCQVADIAITE